MFRRTLMRIKYCMAQKMGVWKEQFPSLLEHSEETVHSVTNDREPQVLKPFIRYTKRTSRR